MKSKITFRSAQPSAHRIMGAPLSLPRGLRWCSLLITAALLVACGGGDGGGPEAAAGGNPPPSVTTPPAVIAPPEVSTPPVIQFTLGGAISGLDNVTGLTLVNGAETLAIAAGASSFTFATQLPPNTTYNVTVGTQPSGLSCSVAKGSGTATVNVNTVEVYCVGAPATGLLQGRGSTVLAGNVDGDGSVDNAMFGINGPIAIDKVGNIYVTEKAWRGTGSKIRKITPAGAVSTLAGNQDAGFIDGVGTQARFSDYLSAIHVDSAGNVYVGDVGNRAIRKISVSGVVSTLANLDSLAAAPNAASGTPVGGAFGDLLLGPTTRTEPFGDVAGIAVDSTGNVCVSEAVHAETVIGDSMSVRYIKYGTNALRKISPSGVMSTVATAAANLGAFNEAGAFASFQGFGAITVDSTDHVYGLVPYGVHKLSPSGVFSALAGSGIQGFVDGVGGNTRFSRPAAMAIDRLGNTYVVDAIDHSLQGTAIRKITPVGNVSTLSRLDGRVGPPKAIAVDHLGNLWLSMYHPQTILTKLSPDGAVLTTIDSHPLVDGFVNAASFSLIGDLAVDGTGNVYVTDGHTAIRRINPAGMVTTLRQTVLGGTPLESLAADRSGNMFFAGQYAIFKMTPTGVVSRLAGSEVQGVVDGTGAAARFYTIQDFATDSTGNVYVADYDMSNVVGKLAIRKISPDGVVATLGGDGAYAVTDVTGFYPGREPFGGITADNTGTVYLADLKTPAILKVSPAGVVTTLAGSVTGGFADGLGTAARFSTQIHGIAADNARNVYVLDAGNKAIRKISPSGLVTTVADYGSPGVTSSTADLVRFTSPGVAGIAVDSAGALYVGDGLAIRKIVP